MKAEKHSTGKVKSKTEQRIMDDDLKIEIITEWNIKRIVVVLLLLLSVVMLALYFFNNSEDNAITAPLGGASHIIPQDSLLKHTPQQITLDDSPDQGLTSQVLHKAVVNKRSKSARASSATVTSQIFKNSVSATKTSATEHESQQTAKITSSGSTPKNPHISRAQLSKSVKNKEPVGQLILPLLVNNIKAQQIVYFTEVNDFQGNTVFHQWLKEGDIKFNRKIIIGGNRWRISTSKLFTYKSVGQWQVRIMTKQGQILHKIDFSVEK